MRNVYILIMLLLVSLVGFYYLTDFSILNDPEPKVASPKIIEVDFPIREKRDRCIKNGGRSQESQCLGISKEKCEELGGEFDTCGSLCDSRVQVCPTVCVEVCRL